MTNENETITGEDENQTDRRGFTDDDLKTALSGVAMAMDDSVHGMQRCDIEMDSGLALAMVILSGLLKGGEYDDPALGASGNGADAEPKANGSGGAPLVNGNGNLTTAGMIVDLALAIERDAGELRDKVADDDDGVKLIGVQKSAEAIRAMATEPRAQEMPSEANDGIDVLGTVEQAVGELDCLQDVMQAFFSAVECANMADDSGIGCMYVADREIRRIKADLEALTDKMVQNRTQFHCIKVQPKGGAA